MGSRFLRTQRRPFPASSLWIVWWFAASVAALPGTCFGDPFDKDVPVNKALSDMPPRQGTSTTPSPTARQPQANPTPKNARTSSPANRSLADLTKDPPENGVQADDLVRPEFRPLQEIPADVLQRSNVRLIRGKVLHLYTDLPSQPAVDELPHVFELALPEWCAYFGIRADRVDGWRVDGCLMRDKAPFEQLGLLPRDLPNFLHGYAREQQIWVLNQPSDYYTRHLILHEGTHALMAAMLGGNGPTWYSEGMAEFFGTHRWSDGKLLTRIIPQNRDDVPNWGRILLVQNSIKAGRILSLEQVMQYGPTEHLKSEPYGWSWAAAYFLDQHPRTQRAFRELRQFAPDSSLLFSQQFLERIKPDWRAISEDWRIFASQIDYGYDVVREQIEHRPANPLPNGGATVAIDSARGWQSTGIRLEAGKSYSVEAEGRFDLQTEPKRWTSEAGGITLHYHRGFPLGALLGAVCGNDEAEIPNLEPLNKPGLIGTGRSIRISTSGILFLRINDWSRSLADNQGRLAVRVKPQ